MMAGGLALLRLARRELRQPTGPQVKAFAEPAARILGRHADLSMLSPDLVDGISAGYAVIDYAQDGPMLSPAGPRVRHVGDVDQADTTDGRVVFSGPPDQPPPPPAGPDTPRIAWDPEGKVVTLPSANGAQITYAS